jgi:hypothetical protein
MLVTGGVLNQKEINWIKKLSNIKMDWENDSNNMCLIYGNTDFTFFLGMVSPRVKFLSPIPIMNMVLFGTIKEDLWTGQISYHPSIGWIYTSGENGIKRWDGSFWGNLKVSRLFDFYMDTHYVFLLLMGLTLIFPVILLGGTRYFGVTGFSGIKILNLMRGNANYYYLGYALRVGLTYETPEYD